LRFQGVKAEVVGIGSVGGVFRGKPVAASAQGFDDWIGLRDGGIEFFAEVGDVGLDDVGVVFPVEVVEVLEQLLLVDDDARAVHEVLEDVVLSGREVDKDTGAVDGLFQSIEGCLLYTSRCV